MDESNLCMRGEVTGRGKNLYVGGKKEGILPYMKILPSERELFNQSGTWQKDSFYQRRYFFVVIDGSSGLFLPQLLSCLVRLVLYIFDFLCQVLLVLLINILWCVCYCSEEEEENILCPDIKKTLFSSQI